MLITECRVHYDYFMLKYPDARLLFNDTDSLYYNVVTNDLEKNSMRTKSYSIIMPIIAIPPIIILRTT